MQAGDQRERITLSDPDQTQTTIKSAIGGSAIFGKALELANGLPARFEQGGLSAVDEDLDEIIRLQIAFFQINGIEQPFEHIAKEEIEIQSSQPDDIYHQLMVDRIRENIRYLQRLDGESPTGAAMAKVILKKRGIVAF